MKKDRYVALASDREQGTLRTKPFLVPGDRLTVNARVPRGEVRVRLLDEAGRPLATLGAAEAKPVIAMCWPPSALAASLGELPASRSAGVPRPAGTAVRIRVARQEWLIEASVLLLVLVENLETG